MISNLQIKYQNAQDAYKALSEISVLYFERLETLPLLNADLVLKRSVRDGLIQNFEFTVEAIWKLLLELLIDYFKSNCAASPRVVFREAIKAGLLSEAEVEICLNMVDDRNLSSHTYKEHVALALVERIPSYNKILSKILKLTKTYLP
jgi:nucleotidyltransferase substrate binding protein (TIGR01987 family)